MTGPKIDRKGSRRTSKDGDEIQPPFDAMVTIRLSATAAVIEDCARLMLSEGYFLNVTELRILGFLNGCPSASISDIARHLQVDKAWISRRIRPMAKRKLVIRKSSLSDSRHTLVSLTAIGSEFYERVMSDVMPHYAAIMDGIDGPLLLALLDRLETNVRSVATQLRQNSIKSRSNW